MAKYRKIPVIIDAEEYKKGMEDGFFTKVDETGKLLGIIPFIQTLEGKHEITEGDFIVTGIKGERYPVKPDIFALTYEKVED